MVLDQRKNTATFIRWVARVWGSLILAFILFLFVAQLMGKQGDEDIVRSRDMISFTFFHTGISLGLALSFKWDGLGGLITLLSLGSMILVRSDLLEFSMIMLAAGPAALYIMYWFLSRKRT